MTRGYIIKITVCTLLLCLVASTDLLAQITLPGDSNEVTDTAPLDGLIALGILAGGYLGVRKLKK
tara:strand:+ start:1052 stop:1246 length:195 start_codon:yes stop_codon:yes gene_type:complete